MRDADLLSLQNCNQSGAQNYIYTQTRTLQKKRQEKYSGDLKLGNVFSDIIPKVQFMKEKIDKFGFVEIKISRLAKWFCALKHSSLSLVT